MDQDPDLLIIGAGPAGMSAAIRACAYGLTVMVIDEQAAPGGQIWRNIETVGKSARAKILGASYLDGLVVTERFRKCGADFAPNTSLWHIEAGPRAFLKANAASFDKTPKAVLLATGAQERPVPFPGWTLPGVMTVGAGQILLKSSNQVPEKPVWIAGCGPLAFLYAIQLLDAGSQIAGFLDTTPRGRTIGNLLPLAKAGWGAPADLLKGLKWLTRLKATGRYIPHVQDISAHGNERLEELVYRTSSGKDVSAKADLLMVHEGIVPIVHPTKSLGCKHAWDHQQSCYVPVLDHWGQTSEEAVYVAGDGAGIGGAVAASCRGEIAAIGIAKRLGYLSDGHAEREARPVRKELTNALAPRPFLDRIYHPRPQVFSPKDDALVCRCEEVTAKQIRALCANGHVDPNQIKASTRGGMGPCQGRLCNYPVAHIIAEKTGTHPSDIGIYRVRPPFKPLTLEELATLGRREFPE